MTTEAEWQAALADLGVKKLALREAEDAFALADKLVAQLYRERNPKSKRTKPMREPRYDAVYFEGVEALERMTSPDANHPDTGACPDVECTACGARDCPHGEPLHYHHDGCPACYLKEVP